MTDTALTPSLSRWAKVRLYLTALAEPVESGGTGYLDERVALLEHRIARLERHRDGHAKQGGK